MEGKERKGGGVDYGGKRMDGDSLDRRGLYGCDGREWEWRLYGRKENRDLGVRHCGKKMEDVVRKIRQWTIKRKWRIT